MTWLQAGKPENWSSIIGSGVDFCICPCIQTSSRANPAPYPVSTGDDESGHEAIHLLYLVLNFKGDWSYTSTGMLRFTVGCSASALHSEGKIYLTAFNVHSPFPKLKPTQWLET